MKFRTKTIIGVALIECLLLTFLGLSVIGQLERSNQQSIERRVETTSRLLAASLRDAMIAYDLATVETVAKEILGTGELTYLRIVDAGDQTISELGALPAGQVKLDDSLGSVDDGVFDREMRVEVMGQMFGRIQYGFDVSPFQQLIRDTRKWTFTISLMEMALVALFSYVLGTYLTRQLLLLRNSSKAVADGDLNQSVPVVGRDELAETAASFNHMVDQLRAAEVERQEHNQAMREALTAAESANVAKSRFLATMSHELRTPMNGILGMAQILQMSDLAPRERAESVQTILNSGEALLALVNDILDLSKIEAGHLELHLHACNPVDVAREVVDLHRANAGGKGLKLTVQTPSGAPGFYLADTNRLRQMIGNLVGNAIKFTDVGQIDVELEACEIAPGQTGLCIAVIDTGIGIPDDRQGELFKPFTQVDDSSTRRFSGTGLGLSIVRTLAQLMGGEAGVSSQAGKGSTFWFKLPLTPVAPSAVPQAAPETVSEMRFRGRVLVAEDNPVNQQVIRRTLEKFGVDVVLANNGKMVSEIYARDNAFDLVLMDISMPVMDGYEATAAIRRWCQEQGKPVPVIIAFTADAYEEERLRCLEAGMADVMTKPLQLSRVREVLQTWLPAADELGASQPAGESVGDAELVAVLSALLPLLRDNRFEGIRRFEECFAGVADSALRADLSPVGDALAAIDFAGALDRLDQLAKKHGWVLASDAAPGTSHHS